MKRLLLSDLHQQKRSYLVAVFGIASTALVDAIKGSHFFPVLLALAAVTLLLHVGTAWFRFGRRTSRFRAFQSDGAELRYAPELHETIDAPAELDRWRLTLFEMQERFGFRLKRSLVVYLFPTMAEVSRWYGRSIGACALVYGDAVVAAVDEMRLNPKETMSHEITHLFSAYWDSFDPPLKSEGLAVWLQGSLNGKSIDYQALSHILGRNMIPLHMLLPSTSFYGDMWYSYAIAGSFTGFLIQSFGWDTYRAFFKSANHRNFEAAFQRNFGVSFLFAERQWRKGLVARKDEFLLDPAFQELLHEKTARCAYNSWQPMRCLEELHGDTTANRTAENIWLEASAYALLYDFERAVALLEGCVQKEDPWLAAYRASIWVQIGMYYDLLQQRDKAILAYQNALAAPDCWERETGGRHAKANRYLKSAFTEKEFLLELTGGNRGQKWLQ